MLVGCLGEVVFQVTPDQIETLQNVEWSVSARYAEHQREGNALTEMTGNDADKFSFTLQLSKYLGVDPMAEMVKLLTYTRQGTAVPLTIGKKGYGKYRWVITDVKNKLERFDRDNNVSYAEVDVSLLEYLKE